MRCRDAAFALTVAPSFPVALDHASSIAPAQVNAMAAPEQHEDPELNFIRGNGPPRHSGPPRSFSSSKPSSSLSEDSVLAGSSAAPAAFAPIWHLPNA